MIISASRRTDIPAGQGAWLLERLEAAWVDVPNPRNPHQLSRIDLSPGAVDGLVFWTKDPSRFLPLLPRIDALGYRYYFQFTLNPYGPDIEGGLSPREERLAAWRALAEKLGSDGLVWRYDPILFSRNPGAGGDAPEWNAASHRAAFAATAAALFGRSAGPVGASGRECVVSFLDDYAKIRRALAGAGLRPPSSEEAVALAADLADIAGGFGLRLRACCEPYDLKAVGIDTARCIDPERIARIIGRPPAPARATGQRPLCFCAPSRDIGRYGSCRHNCVYCYAR